MTSAAKSRAARTVGLLLCTAAAAALSGCKPGAQQAAAADAPPPLAALPLTGDAAPQTQPGPVAVDLPNARPARLGPLLDAGDGYAYLDRAYFLNDAFAEAPPDYGFDYVNDEMPWVWRTDEGFVRIVEFLPYGARYYYFEPGEDYPFLISDPDYDYAFADGDIVAIYDSAGSLLPPEDLALRAPLAGRELARAEAMFRASRRNQEPVALASWTARRNQVASDLGRWRGLESHQPAWRTYHRDHLAAEQAHFAPERFRRAAETARLDRQIHDPDGAEHALRVASQAQDIARRAHVNIALAPRRGQPVDPNIPGTRMARDQAGPGRGPQDFRRDRQLAMGPGGPGEARALRAQDLRIEHAPEGRMTAAEPARTQRLAMARIAPEPRAQYNFRDRSAQHEPGAFAEPHLRAAEQFRAYEPPRTARAVAPALASREFRPHAEFSAARPPQAPHLQIVQAAPHPAGGPASFAGARPAGPGGHPAPPQPHAGNDRRR